MEWPEGASYAPSRELVQRIGDWELQVADIKQHFAPPRRSRLLEEITGGARKRISILSKLGSAEIKGACR